MESEQEAADIASVSAELTRWQDNVDELGDFAESAGLDEAAVGTIMKLIATYLEHRCTLFEERAHQGLAREGHGDLLAADIFCMEDGPRILDCLAFDPALRKGDVLADIAFLVMDIERLAGPRAGQRVLQWYQEFSNERLRKELAHHDRTEHGFATPDTGLYAPEITIATYAELNSQAAQLLVRGESVVLDAAWSAASHRAEARARASALGATVIELECRVDPALAKERIVRRMSSPWTVSDATPEIVDHLAAMHDPWPEAVAIDTTSSKHHSRS